VAGVVAAVILLERGSTVERAVSKPSAPRSSQPQPGIGIVRQGTDAWRAGSGYRAYSYLIVSLDLARRAAREPGRSLVYFAAPDVNTRWNAGVPYDQARRHGWLLRDRAGKLLVNRGYPENYIGDVGNPGYQRAWLANVTRLLAADGDDGVVIDDVLADLAQLAGTEAAKYPTPQAWAAAQLSFVRTVGDGLRARGYYVLVNASSFVRGSPASDNGSATLAWWRQLAPHVSGLENEYYQETSDGSDTLRSSGSAWNQGWAAWQRLVTTAQSLGKDFFGLSYGPSTDARTMSYGKASFLMDWNGAGGAYIYEPTEDEDREADPWNGAWTTDIGRPAAPKRRVGAGWLRQYSGGVALVNPSPSSPQAFSLPGSYLTPSGGAVSRVTLPPTTGLVLPSAAASAIAAPEHPRRGTH